MAFKDLHKLKKIIEVQKESIEIDHLVVGKDIFAQNFYFSLCKKFGSENVRWLSEDVVNRADLYLKGPSTFRGEANRKMMEILFPELTLKKIENTSLFYKDMTWKAFGGRSRSEVLKFDELFYVEPRFDIDLGAILNRNMQTDEDLESINQLAYHVAIKNIKKIDDLFWVECINGTEFHAKNLYFGKSPFAFLNTFGEKNQLSDEFIQYCESTRSVHGLFVKYIFEKALTDLTETLYIPLSYTHEWGHFVGEFHSDGKNQVAEFVHFVDEDHTSEEEISKDIRQLRKSFEKIFENFLKAKYSEFIAIESSLGKMQIDDTLFHRAKLKTEDFFKNLHFFGVNAPLSLSFYNEYQDQIKLNEVAYMARGLAVEADWARAK